MRRRNINTAAATKSLQPPILKPSGVITARKSSAEVVESKGKDPKENGDEEKQVDGNGSEDDKEKPPVLEEIKKEPTDSMEESSNDKAPSSHDKSEDKMDVDEDSLEDDEDFDQKPDLEDLDYEVARYTQKKTRDSNRKKASNVPEVVEEKQVTYTTRGRRHTLPRRYAEFTGHDNVASILKSQQRASGTNAGKTKKVYIEKPKTPTKPKAAPKPVTPKKPDGSRPECVYKLIADVQAKEVDESGDIILWDPIPSVKVNQQQLISVIFRSSINLVKNHSFKDGL